MRADTAASSFVAALAERQAEAVLAERGLMVIVYDGDSGVPMARMGVR